MKSDRDLTLKRISLRTNMSTPQELQLAVTTGRDSAGQRWEWACWQFLENTHEKMSNNDSRGQSCPPTPSRAELGLCGGSGIARIHKKLAASQSRWTLLWPGSTDCVSHAGLLLDHVDLLN